jgi:hypothetical protein
MTSLVSKATLIHTWLTFVMAQLIHSFSRLCAAVDVGNNRLLWFACYLEIESGVLGYCAIVAVCHRVAYEYDAALAHRSSYVQAM